jgi:GrpB-like predicted nucleotidyltransferase (UPF0157 family)
LFAKERCALQRIDALINIEHFGSTAVPGLVAKPIIDILASVVRLTDIADEEKVIFSLGYRDFDAGFARRRFYRKQDVGPGVGANLHIITADRWGTKSERLFRDWLIDHPRTAQRYARLKRELAVRHPDDVEAYTAAKSEFIREVVNLARSARGMEPETDWLE